MIPEKNRLKRQRDFEIIMSEGMFVPSRFLTAKIWKIDLNKYPKRGYSPDDLKIGFSVGIKISKSAVVRNRLRRQMREVVRLALKEDKILPGHMVLFIAKPKMMGINYKEIERDILDVLVRGKIIAR